MNENEPTRVSDINGGIHEYTPGEGWRKVGTDPARCTEFLVIRGEQFPCDLHPDHEGWAHSSRAGEAIWGAA